MIIYLDFQGGAGWENVSAYVRDDFTITHRASSDDYKYAVNLFDFRLTYNASIMSRLHSTLGYILVKVMEDDNITYAFAGRFVPCVDTEYNGILDLQMVSLTASDYTSLLDVETTEFIQENMHIQNPADEPHSLVHLLFTHLGLSHSLIDPSVSILDEVGAAALDENGNALAFISTLMYEYGWVPNWSREGLFSPIRWIQVEDSTPTFSFTDANVVGSIKETSREIEKEAAKVFWYGLGTRTAIRVYTESLNYDEDGDFEGYPILATTYYPDEANVMDDTQVPSALQIVEQEYQDVGIRYSENKYIEAGYAQNFSLEHADFTRILVTKNHAVYDEYEAGLTRDIATFGNKKARIRYYNPNVTSRQIYYMHINADVVYTKSKCSCLVSHVASTKRIEEYDSSYLFTAVAADRLAKAQASALYRGRYNFKVSSLTAVEEGTFVSIVSSNGLNTTGLILERVYNDLTGIYDYSIRSYDTNYIAPSARTVRISSLSTNDGTTIATLAPKSPSYTVTGDPFYRYYRGETVPENTNVTLTAIPTDPGYAATYQWYYRTVGGVDTIISGQTSASIVIAYNVAWYYSGVPVFVLVNGKFVYTVQLSSITMGVESSTRQLASLSDVGLFTGEVALYLGQLYSWGGASWALKNAVVPTGEIAHYTGSSLPDIPDNAAGTLYLQDAWATTDSYTPARCTLAVSGGKLIVTATAANPNIYRPIPGFPGKTIIAKIKKVSGASLQATITNSGAVVYSSTHSHNGNIFSLHSMYYPADAGGYVSIYLGDGNTVSGDIFEVDFIYVGTGAYDTQLIDNSGNGNHATIYNACPVIGISGNGLSFNGVNSKVTIPSMIWPAEWTVSCWIKPVAWDSNKEVYSRAIPAGQTYEPLRIYLSTTTGVLISFSADSTTTRAANSLSTAGAIPLGVLSLVSIVRSGGNILVYINGVLDKTTAVVIYDGGASVFYLASRATSNFWEGVIEEPRLYARALTAAEVLGLYLVPRGNGEYYDGTDYLVDQAAVDGRITPGEKVRVLQNWTEINGNGSTTGSYWTNKAKAGTYTPVVATTALDAARDALYAYLYTSPNLLSSQYWETIYTLADVNVYRALWSTYRSAETALLTAIANKEAANAQAAAILSANTSVPTLAPKYLGIGRLSATGTALFAGYAVSAPTVIGGVITVNSVVSSVGNITPNPGDWMLNYYNAGVAVLQIHIWSGTAWATTLVNAEHRAAALEDIYRLNCVATPIVITEGTTYIESLMYRMFAKYIKVLTGGSIRGGDRYNESGTIIDGTKPGFFIPASGVCKFAGIEFEGSQGGGVQWGAPALMGTPLAIASVGAPSLCNLDGSNIAVYEYTTSILQTYQNSGTTWAPISSGNNIGVLANASLAALSPSGIAIAGGSNTKIRYYGWSGTTWSPVSSGNTIPGALGSMIAALSPTDIAFADLALNALRLYRWNGATWNMIGNEFAIANLSSGAITALNGSDIALINSADKSLTVYRYSHPSWAKIGSSFSLVDSGLPSITALNGTDVAVIDYGTDQLRLYRWDGATFSLVSSAGKTGIVGAEATAMAALNGTDVALLDSYSNTLRTYRFGFALSNPWRYPFTS
jgi:hypothetical protein